jgi:hypothetical protein
MRGWSLVVICAAGLHCGGSGTADGEPCWSEAKRVATGWRPAERLFRGDDFWVGADVATSIDLGGGRILWLFGDSFIAPDGDGSRAGAPFARNTIAIQHGYDPAAATIDFHFGRAQDGTPEAFFASDAGDTWLWPGAGIRVGERLVLFMWRMRSTAAGGMFGFAVDAPRAVLIANPDDDPSAWRATSVVVPANPWNVFLGTGAAVIEGGYLYLLSCVEPGNHDVYLARWPVASAAEGRFDDPEWFLGNGGWQPQSALAAAPARLFGGGHTEFSVFFDADTARYVQLQATGFPGDLTMRTAPALTGPWSEARVVYRPPELACSGTLTYAAKAHPALSSPDLARRIAVSYASNADFSRVVNDLSLYFPRFVRLDVAAGSAAP